MIENNHSEINVKKLSELLSVKNVRIVSKSNGGNSRVYCVEAAGEKWAVKSYPPYAPGQRDRLSAECKIYQFLNQNQIASVPALKTYSEDERWLILEWIEGDIPNTYSESDLLQAITFLRHIKALNMIKEANNLPLAAEACLSLTILLNQIKRRLQNLFALSAVESDLHDFLIHFFSPAFEYYQDYARTGYIANQIDPDCELSDTQRSLIPADFGFHNSMRSKTGKLYFFDFDYFGWDDPVKLLADIIWHPKMNLSTHQQHQFIHGFSAIYSHDHTFLLRFHYSKLLYGLRWVLILLNEFIPAFWQNRQHAGIAVNQAEAKQLQLKRAKELLLRIKQIGNSYDITIATSI